MSLLEIRTLLNSQIYLVILIWNRKYVNRLNVLVRFRIKLQTYSLSKHSSSKIFQPEYIIILKAKYFSKAMKIYHPKNL